MSSPPPATLSVPLFRVGCAANTRIRTLSEGECAMKDEMQYPRLIATFRPEQWQDDHAVPTGDNVEFDATARLLSLPLDRIRGFREYDLDSDDLAADLPRRHDHD